MQKEAQRARLKELEKLKLSDFIDNSDLKEIEKEILKNGYLLSNNKVIILKLQLIIDKFL